MIRTRIIGIGLIVVGGLTSIKFAQKSNIGGSAGVALLGFGVFLLWNGWVAEYNQDLSFAIFG